MTTMKAPLDIDWREDVLRDEWVDASIREWFRMKDDGLLFNERFSKETHKRAKDMDVDTYYLILADASLRVGPDVKCRATAIQLNHRIKTFMFFASLIQQVGNDRVRERWDVMETRGEVQP